MKKYALILAVVLLSYPAVFAQVTPKTNPKNQQEMQEELKKAQAEYDKLTPEQKKMMEQMGIKLPDAASNPALDPKSSTAVNTAMQKESGVVPVRDAARIAAIPKSVTEAKIQAYISALHQNALSVMDKNTVNIGDACFDAVKSEGDRSAGNLAAMLWADGKAKIALYLMGRTAAKWPTDDNISNYAAMASMMGGEHLAIPVLEIYNRKYPKNSTLLNNLGQAWFGLGELEKAGKYLDSAIAIYPYHPQANLSKAAIEESKGNKQKAIDAIKRSMAHAWSQDKENSLRKLGYSPKAGDAYLPPRTKNDLFQLGGFTTPSFPVSAKEYVSTEWKSLKPALEEKATLLMATASQASAQRGQKGLKSWEQQYGVKAENITSQKDIEQMMKNSAASAKTAIHPLFYSVARRKEQMLEELYRVKIKDYEKRLDLYMKGEFAQRTKAYEDKKKQYDKIEQNCQRPGGGCITCEQWEQLADEYLQVVNPKLEQFYKEHLAIQKVYFNEKAYYALYQEWPAQYASTKASLQAKWLNALALGGGVKINIDCIAGKKAEKHSTKIPDFDEEAFLCKYKSEVSIGQANGFSYTSDCSSAEFIIKIKEAGQLKNIEAGLRLQNGEYKGSTLKFGTKRVGTGKEYKDGPLTVGAVAGVATKWTIVHDADNGVNWTGAINVGIEASAKLEGDAINTGANAGVGVEFEIGKSGVTDVNIVGNTGAKAGIGGKNLVEVGIEARSSIVSGNGSVKGTGLLEKIIQMKW